MTHQNRILDPTEQFNEIHEEYNDNGAHHNVIVDEEEGEVTALPKTFFWTIASRRRRKKKSRNWVKTDHKCVGVQLAAIEAVRKRTKTKHQAKTSD